MVVVNGFRSTGSNKGVLSRTLIANIGDIGKDDHLPCIARFHELNKIDLEARSSGPDGQPHRTGGFTNPLSSIDMNETKTEMSDWPRTFFIVVHEPFPLLLSNQFFNFHSADLEFWNFSQGIKGLRIGQHIGWGFPEMNG